MFFVLFQPIIQKNIFFYRFFGADFLPLCTVVLVSCTLSDAPGEAFGWFGDPASGEMHSRRLFYRRVAQVGASEWRMRMWAAQVGGVDGAGQ